MSSRLLVFLVPFLVIGIFWLMARQEAKTVHDPSHKGYFERNGMTLGLIFIFLVALWTLFLVVLPYLTWWWKVSIHVCRCQSVVDQKTI